MVRHNNNNKDHDPSVVPNTINKRKRKFEVSDLVTTETVASKQNNLVKILNE